MIGNYNRPGAQLSINFHLIKAKMLKKMISDVVFIMLINEHYKGSLTLAMGKCLWFSVKIKVCQLSLSSP